MLSNSFKNRPVGEGVQVLKSSVIRSIYIAGKKFFQFQYLHMAVSQSGDLEPYLGHILGNHSSLDNNYWLTQ